MVNNLGQEITHIIHPHKKSSTQAIIRHYNYENNERITTTVGLKSDFLKKRRERQFKHMETRTDLTPKVKEKRGRPKGSTSKNARNIRDQKSRICRETH